MGFYGHGWGMMLSMVVFWAIVLGVGLWLVASLFPRSTASRPAGSPAEGPASDPAVQAVRQRYANGEISKGEYEEILQVLKRAAPIAGDASRCGPDGQDS